MKVAVVRNRSRDGVINRFGQACPEVYGAKTVQMTIDALREAGHIVRVMEGDKTLLAGLEEFMPPDAEGRPTGIVFNMAYGIQGESRYTHVPALLEMAGIPYTGAGPLGHAMALDKVITKILIRNAGLLTPDYRVMNACSIDPAGLQFPLVIKPRHESTSFGLHVVENHEQLRDAVLATVEEYQQDALVEEYIDGREVAMALLGNQTLEPLPLVEVDFGARPIKALTWGDKYHKRPDEPQKVCPAPVPAKLAHELRAAAVATFRACHCRDYSRVDVRIDRAGRPHVLEINSMASLGPGGSYVMAALAAGYTYSTLIARILDVAHQRYFGVPAPRETAARERPTSDAGCNELGSGAESRSPASRSLPP